MYKFYVVLIANKLYVANPMFQTTTQDMLAARHFLSFDEAQKVASKRYNAKVVAYKIIEEGSREDFNESEGSDELYYSKLVNKQLRKELSEAETRIEELEKENRELRKACMV